MTDYLQNFLTATWYLIAIPALFGCALSLISHCNKALVVKHFGFLAQVIGGGIGIIIHELSHLIVALLFRHHIQGVALLRIPNYKIEGDTQLGYVQHTWQPSSLYQQSGNFFIGLAPLIGETLSIIALTKLLVPPVFSWWLAIESGNPQADPNGLVWWKLLVWLILLVNISVGGFDLSPADLANSGQGVLSLLVIYLAALVIVTLALSPAAFKATLLAIMIPIYWALGLALAINIATWGLVVMLGKVA
jgi:hypothetical protein